MIFIIYILFAEFYIEKKISEMPEQIENNESCNCNNPKIIEKITDFKSLIKKKPAQKKKIINWNNYFEMSKKMFTTNTFSEKV